MSIYILKEKTRTNLRANEFRTSFWGRLGEWFEETIKTETQKLENIKSLNSEEGFCEEKEKVKG